MILLFIHDTPLKRAILSALFPGLGLFARQHFFQAIQSLVVGASLCLMAWGIGMWGGIGAGIFWSMMVVLPWWVFQAYQSTLDPPPGLSGTWRIIWEKGHDIHYLGALFFIAAFMDLYIILANPTYSLHVFCTRPTGIVGALVKAQSPTFHLAIGYGFLRKRRWALLVYLVYAGYGLINATVNFACEGYGRIRTVFFITLVLFTVYVLFRRKCFLPAQRQYA